MVKEKGYYELLLECTENSLEDDMKRLYLRAKAELYNYGFISMNTHKKKACEVFIEWVEDY